MRLEGLRRGAAVVAVAGLLLTDGGAAWGQVNTNPLSVIQFSSQQANQAALQANAQRTSAVQDALDRTNAGERSRNRAGSAVEAEGGPALQTANGRDVRREADGEPEPFGASLFENTGTLPPSDSVNPDYQIQPGDKIGLNVLGAASAPVTADLGANVQTGASGAGATSSSGAVSAAASQQQTIQTVDPQGNIFLPEVGAVHVGGVRATALQSVIQGAAGRAYTLNVRFYAVLLTTHRVGVFVGGFVQRPGRYAGQAADSVLDYLIRAGGVDPSRGSYRDITVRHGGADIAHVDLYDFLLTGRLPTPNLREGDTIFVQKQGPTVVADGSVRNNYLFELKSSASTGGELVALARPLPSATDAVITGAREGKPYSQYVPIPDLPRTSVRDQDRVTFVGDRPATTVRVRVEGSRIGPSVLVLPTDTRLPAAVAQIRTDPALADLKDVYVLRRSVAQQQARVIEEAAERLERALFLATSPTSGVATIRASEAQLVSSYIQRARRTAPDGRIVVADEGRLADLRLEEDDVIVIPKLSQTVLVSGEVLQPQAVLWRPGLKREDYVRLAGGFSERGRRGHFLIRRANGSFILDRDVALQPGDELVALPFVDPKYFQIGSDVLSLVYQIAIAASVARNY